MKGSNLGEFQEYVMLTILLLDQNAYGVTIQNEINHRMKRSISRGALHSALSRLDEKGYIESFNGEPTPERGGRRKRYYRVTSMGMRTLKDIKELRDDIWKELPKLSWI